MAILLMIPVQSLSNIGRIYPNIHLLHNPDRYVPYALNKAISAAKGEIIVRLDAHTRL